MSLARRSSEPPTFPDYPPTVPALLADGARRFGDRDCVVTPTDRLTYRELDQRSAGLAAALVRSGVGRSSRVAILFPNGVDWVLSWAAVTRIGAVALPVNTFSTPRELLNFLRDADVQYLLGVGSLLMRDYLRELEEVLPEIAQAQPPLYLPGLPALRRAWVRGATPRSWSEPWPSDPVSPDRETIDAVVAGLQARVTPSDDMIVMFTSGSTDEPKGVIHSHGALVRHGRNLAAASNVEETSRLWSPMPLCWVGGFVWNLLRAMSVGGCYLTQEVFAAESALALLEREGVTDVAGWPHVMQSLLEHPAYIDTDLSALRDGLPAALAPERRAEHPVGSLGMSETGGPHTGALPAERRTGSPAAYRGSFGHPLPGLEHRIVDPDAGVDLPDGAEGEVLVRGYSLMKGLEKREAAAVFDADGWFHAGDRGVFRDGWFFFTGRQSDLIKTRGSNVTPAEVERQLMGVPGVDLAVVLGVPHEVDGEQVVAFVVAREGAVLPPEPELRRIVRVDLAPYKMPRHVFVLAAEDVPSMSSQKVDRSALTRMALERIQALQGN